LILSLGCFYLICVFSFHLQRFCRNHCQRRRQPELSQRPGAKVFFRASESRSLVAVSLDGSLFYFHSIGQLGPKPPTSDSWSHKYLAKSQLVADHSVGEVGGWELQMTYGEKRSEVGGDRWLVRQVGFPVEISQLEEFYQWLASEPRRELFRFCGTTDTEPQLQPTLATLISPLNHSPDACEFPVDQRPRMVLTASLSCGQLDMVHISLLSMGGNELGVVQLRAADTIADLWWEIDGHPSFAGQRVTLLLANGCSLNDTRTQLTTLAEVMQLGSPPMLV